MTIFEPIKQIYRLMAFNWQQKDWTDFSYDSDSFEIYWQKFLEIAGQSQGIMQTAPESLQNESLINLLVSEAIKSSEIEGEFISRIDLISSIRKNLGFVTDDVNIKDKRSVGMAEVLINSRKYFNENLSERMLFDWHGSLMMAEKNILIAKWRTHQEPMQVVSGAMGREIVHFEAPPSDVVPLEMQRFIAWFNDSENAIKNPLIRSAIAHLYFESIHPFEDGNGRIGRIISEKVLSQAQKKPVLLSLSKTIEKNKNAYYEALQKGQSSNIIDTWLHYFCKVIIESQQDFIETIVFSIKKAAFFDLFQATLNVRQQKVIKKMLLDGEDTFVRKYLAIAKTSKATATRDLQDLVERKILLSKGAGRSTNYQVNLD
jgi:Fic family protein